MTLVTVFGYLYAAVFMTMHTLNWSQLADVDADVGSINTAAEATTVSIHKVWQTKFTVYRHKLFNFACGRAVIFRFQTSKRAFKEGEKR